MKKQDKRRTSFPKSREPRESSQFSLCALMVWRWPSDLGLFHQHQCWALRPPCTAPPCRECPDVLASMGRVVFKVLVAQSCPILCDPMGCSPPGSSVLGDSPGTSTGVGCHALLQWIFPTQGLNLGLLHGRQILSYLSHKGNPRILEWVPYPFSSGSSQPRDWTRVSCIAGGFFTNWATREALKD